MKIVVCIKQVPASSNVAIDPDTGVLLRDGSACKMNPYDLYALETAFRIKEQNGAQVHAVTMGPLSAQAVLKEAISMGADQGYLISDRAFAGSDVLSTARILSHTIKDIIGDVDLIICGEQTTDGDTAQVGPEIAQMLDLPHVSWIRKIVSFDNESIRIQHEPNRLRYELTMRLPALITVSKGIYTPRLPSYRRQEAFSDEQIMMVNLAMLKNLRPEDCGLSGSPTQVESMFAPSHEQTRLLLDGTTEESVSGLLAYLTVEKVWEI